MDPRHGTEAGWGRKHGRRRSSWLNFSVLRASIHEQTGPVFLLRSDTHKVVPPASCCREQFILERDAAAAVEDVPCVSVWFR